MKTRDEAIGWAERYGKILVDGEIELGKVNEPWDIGLMPPPENPPLQFLLIEKADRATEAGGRSPKQKAARHGTLEHFAHLLRRQVRQRGKPDGCCVQLAVDTVEQQHVKVGPRTRSWSDRAKPGRPGPSTQFALRRRLQGPG